MVDQRDPGEGREPRTEAGDGLAAAGRNETPRFVALLLAAGRGTRLGLELPKAWLEIEGRSILEWSAQRLARLPGHQGSILTLDEASLEQRWPDAETQLRAAGVSAPCLGGETRQESCRLAHEAAQASGLDFDLVLVHDAARPFFDLAACAEALQCAFREGGALLGHMAIDTLKQVDASGRVERTIDRRTVFQAATPQIFRRAEFARMLAHAAAHDVAGTDEAGLAEACGIPVHAVCAPATNLKITRPEDLLLLRGLTELLEGDPTRPEDDS